MTPHLVVVGTLLQTPSADHLQISRDVAVIVGADGTIVAVEPSDSDVAQRAIDSAHEVVVLGDDQRLLPGLIDLHIHAPQWPQIGTGLDLPLEKWLFEYTFPLEARYADEAFADAVWPDLVATLLAHGSTTAVYYGTVDERATLALAQTCLHLGQRAFVGRVAMDHPEGTPEWYRDPDATTAIERSRRSIAAIRSLPDNDNLVQPIITPRFVPACSDELLAGLAALADETGAIVQTHCSESDWEHDYVLERYGESDTAALARFGLARAHTILAHCDLVSDDDLAHIARLNAAIAHCPLSNAYFGSAVFPVRRALERNVTVGLGTDIAGGSHPGLFHQSLIAASVSRLLTDGVDNRLAADERGVAGSTIDTTTALWMATVAGATALDIPVGLIAVGRQFDALVIDLDRAGSALRCWPQIDDEQRIFEKIIRLAGPQEISRVWVRGRCVSPPLGTPDDAARCG